MATSPRVSPSILTEKTTRVSSWLERLPATPPADKEHQLTTTSAHHDVSPSKRQWRNTDDVLPGQSASAVGSNARMLTLGNSNTFSRVGASTPRRENGLSRETIAALRGASPPITTELLDGVELEPPARVMAVVARLEDGLDQGWIPGWLEVRMYLRAAVYR